MLRRSGVSSLFLDGRRFLRCDLDYIGSGEFAARRFDDPGNLQQEVLAHRKELRKIRSQHVGEEFEFNGPHAKIYQSNARSLFFKLWGLCKQAMYTVEYRSG